MTPPMLAILLAVANPAVAHAAAATDAAPPALAPIQPVCVTETRVQPAPDEHPGLDVHVAPIDIAGDFQAKMLELSG